MQKMISPAAQYLLFALIAANFAVSAQTKPSAETVAVETVYQCNAEVAGALVTTQVDNSKTITETDKRIKILLRVADFLWKPDESTARKYFAEAFELARERFGEKGAEEVKFTNISGAKQDYRFMVISAVAKHDQKLSDKMLDAVLADKAAAKKAHDESDDGGRMLDIAAEMLKVNKPAAFQFARRAAAADLSETAMSWHGFLYQAAEVDQPATDQLYAELLRQNQTNARINDLYFLASYPFGFDRTIGVNNSSMSNTMPKTFAANPNLQRQFLNLLHARTIALEPNEAVEKNGYNLPQPLIAFSLWQDLEPWIAERVPEFLPRAAAAKTHANSLMTGDNLTDLGKRRKSGERWRASFDKKLEMLEENEDPTRLDYLIVDLIFTAKTEPELVKAADWAGKISEETVRSEAVNFIFFKRAEAAVKENRLTDAQTFAEKVSELEHRAVLFFRIAEARLKSENVGARAAEVLDDAVRAALKAPNGVERAQVLLGAAFYYEKYDQFRAADALGEAVKTINRLENPDLTRSSVVRYIKGKDFGYSTSFDVPGYNFEKSFRQVAKKDWNGALVQAENLADKYLRTLAVLAVVSDCDLNVKPESKKSITKPKTAKPPIKIL